MSIENKNSLKDLRASMWSRVWCDCLYCSWYFCIRFTLNWAIWNWYRMRFVTLRILHSFNKKGLLDDVKTLFFEVVELCQGMDFFIEKLFITNWEWKLFSTFPVFSQQQNTQCNQQFAWKILYSSKNVV